MNPVLSRTLIFLGWGMFAVALICPALRDGDVAVPGWKCLVATLCFYPMWFFWPIAPLGVANLLFLFGVLVYCWGGGLERKAYGVYLALAAVVASALVLTTWDGLLDGAYLWLGSLVVTALGFYLADSLEGPARK